MPGFFDTARTRNDSIRRAGNIRSAQSIAGLAGGAVAALGADRGIPEREARQQQVADRYLASIRATGDYNRGRATQDRQNAFERALQGDALRATLQQQSLENSGLMGVQALQNEGNLAATGLEGRINTEIARRELANRLNLQRMSGSQAMNQLRTQGDINRGIQQDSFQFQDRQLDRTLEAERMMQELADSNSLERLGLSLENNLAVQSQADTAAERRAKIDAAIRQRLGDQDFFVNRQNTRLTAQQQQRQQQNDLARLMMERQRGQQAGKLNEANIARLGAQTNLAQAEADAYGTLQGDDEFTRQLREFEQVGNTLAPFVEAGILSAEDVAPIARQGLQSAIGDRFGNGAMTGEIPSPSPSDSLYQQSRGPFGARAPTVEGVQQRNAASVPGAKGSSSMERYGNTRQAAVDASTILLVLGDSEGTRRTALRDAYRQATGRQLGPSEEVPDDAAAILLPQIVETAERRRAEAALDADRKFQKEQAEAEWRRSGRSDPTTWRYGP